MVENVKPIMANNNEKNNQYGLNKVKLAAKPKATDKYPDNVNKFICLTSLSPESFRELRRSFSQ